MNKMNRRSFIQDTRIKHCIYILIILILTYSNISMSSAQAATYIDIITPMVPPHWALLERQLLIENTRYIEAYAKKYINPITGHFECIERWGGTDGPDDVMENFYNWPLLYMLGAPKSTLELFKFIWNGHIEQYTNLGMFYREFITSFDWEHNGEGYAAFMLLPLSDPEDMKTQERIIRFANFYTGRDTTTNNYDPEHKIIRSILNGSKGPKIPATFEYWGLGPIFEKHNLSNTAGDVPMNLPSTSLAVNAYILTGDDHYKNWVMDYVGAWRERTIANGGMIPSIIGLNGKAGEGWDGKWYGGLMGWNWIFGGWVILGTGARIGFNNAYFISGDSRYIEILRKQGEKLLENRVQTEKGLVFLNYYGDNGWYGTKHHWGRDIPNTKFEGLYSNIYFLTLEESDIEHLYDACQPDKSRRRNKRIWTYEYESGRFEGGNEVLWYDFLNGDNPEYPQKALEESFERLRRNIVKIKNETSTADTRRSDVTHELKISGGPGGAVGAATGALVNLTLGGCQPLWAGGLLNCELRYFDPIKRRPGLPDDIAALVTAIEKDRIKVILVNINQSKKREVIVQTGAYGEHQCKRVETCGTVIPVNHKFFTIRLAPGSGAELVIYRSRLVNDPTFAFPWHGNRVPAH